MNRIKVIVIDDERSAREELKTSLKAYPEFELVGEARNADEAREQIKQKDPDLIFLDIRMPEESGFDLLESLDKTPAVIFTTAFDQYAVQAFEVNALDYLMKPIREERFAKAIEKVQAGINKDPSVHTTDRRIFIRDGDKCFFIKTGAIYLIESLGNYSRLYFNDQKAIVKRSLRQWEEILGEAPFFRINRTQIINTDHIREAGSLSKGGLRITLKTGESLEVSNRQSIKLKNLNRL